MQDIGDATQAVRANADPLPIIVLVVPGRLAGCFRSELGTVGQFDSKRVLWRLNRQAATSSILVSKAGAQRFVVWGRTSLNARPSRS